MSFISNFIAVQLRVFFYQSSAFLQVYIAKTSDYFQRRIQDFFKEGAVSVRVQGKHPRAKGMGEWGGGGAG